MRGGLGGCPPMDFFPRGGGGAARLVMRSKAGYQGKQSFLLDSVRSRASSTSAHAMTWLVLALPPAGVLLGLFAAWELYVAVSGINAVTLPPPSRILEVAIDNRRPLAS